MGNISMSIEVLGILAFQEEWVFCLRLLCLSWRQLSRNSPLRRVPTRPPLFFVNNNLLIYSLLYLLIKNFLLKENYPIFVDKKALNPQILDNKIEIMKADAEKLLE